MRSTFEGTDGLYLGFDASCSMCSALVVRLEADFGGDVSVLPLTNPRMARWRVESLGQSPPWLPTLIRVEGDDIDGWVGWKIGPVLANTLGPAKTWSVLGGWCRTAVNG